MSDLELLETYKPIYYFSKHEKYFPCTVEDYILNCSLYKNDEIILEEITDPNQIVDTEIDSDLEPGSRDNDFYLALRKDE